MLSIPRGSTEDISQGPTPPSSGELSKHRHNRWLGRFGRSCFAPRLPGEQEGTRNSFHSPRSGITPSLTRERFPSQEKLSWSKWRWRIPSRERSCSPGRESAGWGLGGPRAWHQICSFFLPSGRESAQDLFPAPFLPTEPFLPIDLFPRASISC